MKFQKGICMRLCVQTPMCTCVCTNSKVRNLGENIKCQLDFSTLIAIVQNHSVSFKIWTGITIILTIIHVHMHLFSQWIIFLYSYLGTLFIPSFFSSPSHFASRNIFSSSWLCSKYSLWMLPSSGYVQNCWAIMHYQLIFLMPLGIIPALTIYKVPTATPHVEMQLHFTACQNNRPFWDHCSFFGLWENTILRAIVTCQAQANSRCFSPSDFIIGRVCLGTECSTEIN